MKKSCLGLVGSALGALLCVAMLVADPVSIQAAPEPTASTAAPALAATTHAASTPAATTTATTPAAGKEPYIGWAVGGSDSGYGAIFRSIDGGATWTRQGSPGEIPDVMLEAVAALDPLTCWVVGESAGGYGTILRTEDGGATWTRQGSPATIPDCGLGKISALDSDTAWVVGTPGTILFTEDGGRNWVQRQTADIPPVLLQGVHALDKDNVWVTGDTYGGYGTIFRTSDGGKTWQRKGSPSDVPDSALLEVHASDEDTAWVASRGTPSPPAVSLLHTEDNGASWTSIELGTGMLDTNSVTTVGEDVVWVTTDADGIYRSDNARDFVWQDSYHGKYSYYLVSICALDEDTAWAAGPAGGGGPGVPAGVVEHTSDGGKTWVGQLELDIALQAVSFTRPSAFFFAEGTTREGFEPFLCVANPGEREAEVSITYMLGDGGTREQSLAVPASSRATVRPGAVLGTGDDPAHDFGCLVACTNGEVIAAERPMYFSYGPQGWTGGSCVAGAPSPSRTWYFAEGCTGSGFEEWICVLNPGEDMAYLALRFQTEEEGERTVSGWGVPPHSRISLKVNDLLGPDHNCSLALGATRPVVAERSMYFADPHTVPDVAQAAQAEHPPTGAAPEESWTGGHCVIGATSLAREYYFAEGCTRLGFEEWLTVQNPGDGPISVEASYEPASGQGEAVSRSYDIDAGRRLTLFVSQEAGADRDLSVRLSSADPFLAERPMYFDYTGCGAPGWKGGHCAVGATAPAREWLFAEGCTGAGFHEWLTLYNPGDGEAEVEIAYLTQEEGALPARTAVVPARSRLNLFVNESAGWGYQFSCRVTTVSGPAIVAERPMYFSYGPGWDGGHLGGRSMALQ